MPYWSEAIEANLAVGMAGDLMPIKVCIVEDNADMRESVALLLNQAPGLRCVSTYATAEAAVRDVPS